MGAIERNPTKRMKRVTRGKEMKKAAQGDPFNASKKIWWRRRRDSNPRDPSGPTPLAGERLRPLGHISVDAYSQLNIGVTRRKFPFLKFFHLGNKSLKMALRGTEWHWVWETFGQFPLQRKRPELRQDSFELPITKREGQGSKSVSVISHSNRFPFL